VHRDRPRCHLLWSAWYAPSRSCCPSGARVERPLDLHTAERAGVEQPAVLARERNALGDALIDDVDADLREPVDVGLAGAEVAAFDRVLNSRSMLSPSFR